MLFNTENPDTATNRDVVLSRWASLLSIGSSILTLGWLAIVLYKNFNRK